MSTPKPKLTPRPKPPLVRCYGCGTDQRYDKQVPLCYRCGEPIFSGDTVEEYDDFEDGEE